MTGRHDVRTNPDGIPAQKQVSGYWPTELIQLPAVEPEPEPQPKRRHNWEWALLYVSPWLIGAGTAIWRAASTGSETFLIVASLLSLALIVALFVMYLEHAEAKK